MKLFGKKKDSAAPALQTADGRERFIPGQLKDAYAGGCERRLYRSLRESIPVIDAAIYKIVRLTGGFSVECSNSNAQAMMDSFVSDVNVNGISSGLESFIAEYLEQLLTYGTAVGEMLVGSGGICGLYNSSLDYVGIEMGEDPLQLKIFALNGLGGKREVEYPELVLCSAIMPEPGRLYGTSILRGLPFVSDILMKILTAVGNNWDRIGNVRFAVIYKPGENERSFSKDRAMQIASEWTKAMKSREPKDFVAVGDVSIHAIGADNIVPDSSVPVRQILEQITAKLSIPPFLLGLSWSTTERMSSQQSDMLTSELEYYRRILGGVIRRICRMQLKLSGFGGTCRVKWDNINLQDEVELAKARLYNAQAEETENRTRKE